MPPLSCGFSMDSMTTDYALALIDAIDDDDLEARVAAMPAEAVPGALAKVMGWAKQMRQSQKFLESRMLTEAVVGEVFTTEQGDYQWVGDRKRVCEDPAELGILLREQSKEWTSTLAKRALLKAFKLETKTYLLELDEVARWEPMAKRLIDDYTKWTEGYPHLRKVTDDDHP